MSVSASRGPPARPSTAFVRGGFAAALLPGLLLGAVSAASAASPSFQVATQDVPPPTPVAEVRRDADGDGLPERLDDTVTVAGRATVSGTALHAGQTRVFVQDATGGIQLFADDEPPALALGDSVVATGVVDHHNGLAQIELLRLDVVSGAAPRSPAALDLGAPPWDLEANEGALVHLEGRVLNLSSNEGGRFLLLGGTGDEEDRVRVFVAYEAAGGVDLTRFAIGDHLEVTGLLGQWDPQPPFDSGYELYPRGPGDMVAVGLTAGRTRMVLLVGGLALLLMAAVAGVLYLRSRGWARSLGEAERRFEAIFQGVAEPLLVVDRQERVREANAAALAVLGRERDELVGRNFLELLWDDDRELARSMFRAAWAGGTVRFAARVSHPQAGERRLAFQTTVAPVRGEDRALVLAHDLTAEEETLEALRASEERLRLLIEQIPAILWTVDPDLCFVSSQGSGLEHLGLEPDEMVGTSLFDYFRTDDPEFGPIQAHRRALEGESVSYDARWDDRIYESHVEPFRNAEGEVAGVIGTALDVTESRKTQAELDEQRAYFTKLFEEAPEAIVVLDEDDVVLQVNPEYTRMFGYTEEEAVGRKNSDLVVPEHLRDEADSLTRRVAGGERINVEAVRQHKDGTPVQVSILSAPVELEGATRVYGLYRDITERKDLEEQFLHSQKMEAVGHLAGGVAHDFHNLLTAVLGHTDLAYEASDDEAVREDLKAVRDAVQRASTLTRQLLTFSRKELTRPRVVRVNEVLDEMKLLVKRVVAEVHELAWEMDPDVPPVRIDPSQLEQIVMNLAVNARDAMPAGGTLTIRTGRTTADAVSHLASPVELEGELAVLALSDTGTGMTPEEKSRMFEPFFTTKEPGKGTGLGLSTVYGIVEQAGGFITVDTERDRGTEFTIYLPAAPEEEEEEEEAPAEKVAARPSGHVEATVLLVEDDAAVRHLAQRVLQKEGYRVLAAEVAEEAMEIVENSAAEVDLLLTDVALPEMSGYELAEEVARVSPGTAVLFMSGYPESDALGRDGGEGSFLPKPFHPNTLARRVREVLGRKRD